MQTFCNPISCENALAQNLLGVHPHIICTFKTLAPQTGWAAHAFVKLASTYDLRIVVVSPVNHFVFTPMLASAAVGTVEYRSMTEPIRVTNPYVDNFVEGRAIGMDVENRKVQVQLTSLGTFTGAFKGLATAAPDRLEPEPVQTQIVYGEDGATVQRDKSQGAGEVIELSYDYLICAVGTASRSSMVPGAKEHCFNLKTSQDSKRIRTAIGEGESHCWNPSGACASVWSGSIGFGWRNLVSVLGLSARYLRVLVLSN